MKKIIFNNFINDLLKFFILCSITLTLIVWIIQAVNFLDIVSEDGHSILTYFKFSLLNIPKIFTKLITLCFFISIFYILSNYEEKNQMIIFWSNGVKKYHFLNILILFSILILILNIFLAYLVVPYTQDKARSFIRSSSLDYFPSLIKQRKFIDTVENLTIFMDKKESNSMERIIIKDNSKNDQISQLIIAKGGFIINDKDEKYIRLKDGIIINSSQKEKLTSFNFDETNFNLNDYKTKTTVTPKIQETKSKSIIKCMRLLKKEPNTNKFINDLYCHNSSYEELLQEIYKRTIMPLYIFLISIISGFLILKSNNNYDYKLYKIKIFLTGILIIIFSQITVNTISMSKVMTMVTLITPLISILVAYLFFITLMKRSS